MLGMHIQSNIFTVSTLKRMVNTRAEESMLLAASNLDLKGNDWNEKVQDLGKILITLGGVMAHRSWQSNDKVIASVEFAYKLVSSPYISDALNAVCVINMSSHDVLVLKNRIDFNDNPVVVIKMNEGEFEELCKGTLRSLREKFITNYHYKENAKVYQKFAINLDETQRANLDVVFNQVETIESKKFTLMGDDTSESEIPIIPLVLSGNEQPIFAETRDEFYFPVSDENDPLLYLSSLQSESTSSPTETPLQESLSLTKEVLFSSSDTRQSPQEILLNEENSLKIEPPIEDVAQSFSSPATDTPPLSEAFEEIFENTKTLIQGKPGDVEEEDTSVKRLPSLGHLDLPEVKDPILENLSKVLEKEVELSKKDESEETTDSNLEDIFTDLTTSEIITDQNTSKQEVK